MSEFHPLFPLLRTLPKTTDRSFSRQYGVREGTMILAPAAIPTVDLVHRAMTGKGGSRSSGWTFSHDSSGAPSIRSGSDPLAVSIATTSCTRALLLGVGMLGIDTETLERVALNARSDDDWLALTEKALLCDLESDEQQVELACRWVLREAYGKALGRGLDVPFARLAFTVRSGEVVLPSTVADGGWAFSLYCCGSLIIGTAARGSCGQPVGT